MSRFPIQTMTRCALFAALTAVCAWTGIPLGHTVFTMQSFAVLLSLGLLGGKWGTAAIGCYLLLGAAGAPVFSGFRGGFGALLGPTGGFLWGFLAAGLCYRLTEGRGRLCAMILAQLSCYGCGMLWYGVYTGGAMGWALLHAVVPYLIPDAAKLLLAYRLTGKLKKRM